MKSFDNNYIIMFHSFSDGAIGNSFPVLNQSNGKMKLNVLILRGGQNKLRVH